MPEIAKVYAPQAVEQKWYTTWETSHFFSPEENSTKPPFTIVIPPPNITGNLHMGHALDNSIQDMLIRYKKMQGFNTLWIPGTDHAGIATQNVVVKALKSQGITKEQLGREEFVKRIWQWKEEYGSNITRQLRRLGCALDWTHERFTMDEGLSKAVTHEFVTLYKEGLIYRGKRLVNWCPKCGTAISDIEVEHEAKKGKLYWLKYPVENSNDFVTVATTRPETMLGDTAVAVNPKDQRYTHLHGKMLILPLVGRRIPIIKDDYVDASFGSGAVKITPAHDQNDFDMGERHALPRINLLTPQAKITLTEFSEEEKLRLKDLEGLDRYAARTKIIEQLTEQGYLEKIEDYDNAISICYRCQTVIEPYLSDQWYVRVKEMARQAILAVEEGRIKYLPERWTKVYLDWMLNLKDWCISRQLWWGHRIPAWYCPCNEVIVAETKPEKCPKCGGSDFEQDPDVFDTWFSSALWPFSTLGWPENTKDLATFYPTSVLVTGYDIITFWVSRMIMLGLHFTGQAPFHTVFIHGLVRDAKGKKMSKSFGNVIDPLVIIDEVGADALRFALISLITGQGQDIKLTKEKITEARNFSNKLWNVSRFVLMNLNKKLPLAIPADLSLADRWIISRYQNLITDVTQLLENYNFGDAARYLYEFLWSDFCDWYVEISKADLYCPDPAKKEKTLQVLLYILEGSLRLLHPCMPFITEELWQILKQNTENPSPAASIFFAPWPSTDKKYKDTAAETELGLLKELITHLRNIKAEMGIQTKEVDVIFLANSGQNKETILRNQTLLKSLARVKGINFIDNIVNRPSQAATGVINDLQFFVPLQGLVDISLEVERLKKEEEKASLEIEHLTKLLANQDFVARANPEAVEKQRQWQSELTDKMAILKSRLMDLSG